MSLRRHRTTDLTRRILGILNDTERVERLGKYNAERSRGIEHQPEWKLLMLQEQDWFNRRQGYQ